MRSLQRAGYTTARTIKKHPERISGCSSPISCNSTFTQVSALSSSVPLPVFSAQVFVVWPAAWAELVQASPPEEACAAPDVGLPEVQALPPVRSALVEA